MDRKSVVKMAGLAIGAMAIIGVIAILQAAPPRPRPKPPVRRAIRRLHRLRRVRRPLFIRRHGLKVIVERGGKVIRNVPAPVVVTSAENLKEIPQKDFDASSAFKVLQVESDNTVIVDIGGQEKSIRLIGVEPVMLEADSETDSPQETHFLRDMLAGEFVHVESDSALDGEDEDGRTVAYLYRAPDKMFVNLELIRQGCALAAMDYPYQYQELFGFYEGKARADGKGIWKSVPSDEATSKPATKPATE